eukprot:GDKJ01024578.1.p1 GENE.GDKJ01024578.1~~GDKJ01024578.1.p1  ORF type:complete len:214 (+),score=9.08 GDKJ01024578.1:39-644(+)
MSQNRATGYVVSFARGYGFINAGSSVEDTKAARYFFHITDVEGSPQAITVGTKVSYEIVRGQDERLRAVEIRNAFGAEISFARTAQVNMNVSARGRRVGLVAPDPRPTFCFAIDQENGEKVFVPRSLTRGQQIEYTLEMGDRGPMATEVTGPMGSKLPFAVAGKGIAPKEDKPKPKPKNTKPTIRYLTQEEQYDEIDDKYM